METSKKLVRGLKDVSPIFEDSGRISVRETPDIQVMSVSSPDGDEDSLFLNTYLASRMGSEVEPGSLVSLLSRASNVCAWNSAGRRTESFGRNIRRHTLFWDELRDILEAGPCGPSRPLGNRNIFLDFEYRHLLYYPKIMHLLDKWVLMLKPTSESLTEGYKMLKAGLALNPHLECFILLQAKADPPVGSTLFERFAALASKHLQIHPGWLGWLDLSDRDHFFEPKLNVEQLHFRPARAWTSPERLTLVDWVESAERGAGEVAP